jgi:hypothetical protein
MNPPVFTWLLMPHLPKVPDHFVQRAQERARNYTPNGMEKSRPNEWKDRTIVYNGVASKSRYQEMFDMGEDFTQWVRENVHPYFNEVEGRVSIGEPGVTTNGAHVDNPAKLRLFYLVNAGGEDVSTVFYIKPGLPFINTTNGDVMPIHHNNMDELIEVDRTQFPVGQWVLFNGYTMHGVVGITGCRINFTVNLQPEHFDLTIVKKGS